MAPIGIRIGIPNQGKVRGDFSPLSYAGLQLWFDAQDAATVFTTDGGSTPAVAGNNVGRWQDKSGNARHATQATAGRRPTVEASAFGAKTGLSFDGGDGLTVGDIELATSAMTVYCVGRWSGLGAFACIVGKWTSNQAWYLGAPLSNSQRLWWWARSTTGAVESNGNVTDSVRRVITGTWSGTQTRLYVNSVEQSGSPGSNSGTIPDVADLIEIGGRPTDNIRYTTGRIGEILVYNTLHDASTRAAFEAYLSARWA